uniref:Gluconeogenesis factor n=1 Tax=Paulinella chromatophora TaxID=39717 RepID=B1X4R4_PAUCH|nr:hypothetical protein PCC_0497 [Paulinella chromatophora]ACB42933.1 hypothetical protein PCC_0497 [Paulinella chromatophora]
MSNSINKNKIVLSLLNYLCSNNLNQNNFRKHLRYKMYWLRPGLVIKRWMITSAVGIILTLIGAAIWADLKPIYWTIENLTLLLQKVTSILPQSVTGPIVLIVGISLTLWGQSRSLESIGKALSLEKGPILINALQNQRKLRSGPNIVVLGGGTGLSTLLRGLKNYSSRITAIVTVSDDGGSSGILRRELGVQPPGDIRNCLTALATEEQLLTKLFKYRFSSGNGLEGHSFGNLFLSALTAITGNFEAATIASGCILSVQGQVVPATNADVQLWAKLNNGQQIEGESCIGRSPSRIIQIGCTPNRPPALIRALEAISQANLIILGPGSLYTSLLPNLLVPELVVAIENSKALPIYVCNMMTQPGETDDLDVEGHIKAIESQLSRLGIQKRLFTTIIVQEDLGDNPLIEAYRQRGAKPVKCDEEKLRSNGYKIVKASSQGVNGEKTLRHDAKNLAIAIIRLYRQQRNTQ